MSSRPVAELESRAAPSHPGRDPSRLRHQFALLSVLAAAVILALAGVGIHYLYGKEMMHMAEDTAHHVARSIFEQERRILHKSESHGGRIALAPGDFPEFDARMKVLLRTFDMHKIKIFSADGTIIYSTEHPIIGLTEKDNPKLNAVLTEGTVVSELKTSGRLVDLRGEEHLDVDVVETYIPIRGSSEPGLRPSPIIGSFEVYVDVSSVRQRVRTTVQTTLFLLGLVLVGVFTLLFFLMKRGMAELQRVQELLHRLATIDALTGVFNRRQVLLRLDEEQARLRRDHARGGHDTVCVLMLDLDHFKRINDSQGHPCGDQVLRQVATRLRHSLRTYDVLGRYGGEEFLVILPDTTLTEAAAQAERMRESIGAQPIACDNFSLTVTVSIGVTSILPAETDPSQAIQRADQALYQAKAGGRNQVCVQAP